MKLQLQADSLRLRIDEAELVILLDEGELRLAPRVGGTVLVEISLRLGDSLAFERAGAWRIELPRAAVLAYVETLPRRDALAFPLTAENDAMTLQFEVDVRDSLHVRGPRRRER